MGTIQIMKRSREASGYTQAPVPATNLKITRCYGVTVLRRYGVMDCRKGPHL